MRLLCCYAPRCATPNEWQKETPLQIIQKICLTSLSVNRGRLFNISINRRHSRTPSPLRDLRWCMEYLVQPDHIRMAEHLEEADLAREAAALARED